MRVSPAMSLQTPRQARGASARMELGWLPVSTRGLLTLRLSQYVSLSTTGGGMPGHHRGPDALSPQGGEELCVVSFYSPCHPKGTLLNRHDLNRFQFSLQ